MVKSGCHHPKGILMMYGAGIKRGVKLRDCTTLDIAPTLLSLLDVPIPSFMKPGLCEAFEDTPRIQSLSSDGKNCEAYPTY
jgi:hypothetical protein